MTLALHPVGDAELPALANLIQLYIHDFSELFTGTPRCELGTDGRYALDKPLATWLATRGHVALLLHLEGRLAGFAQIEGTTDADATRRIAEFFVVRKHRRTGVGLAAATALFDRWPGRWLAEVMRRNTGAAAFWPRAIAAHPCATEITVMDRNDADWNGPVWHFTIGGAGPRA
jgi:predicted acetyltransferase